MNKGPHKAEPDVEPVELEEEAEESEDESSDESALHADMACIRPCNMTLLFNTGTSL